MNKRFTLMKSIFMFAVILLSALTLVACGDKDQTLVDEALDSVSLVFASGDSATRVTKNLTLPASVGDVQISWVSDYTSVISNTGVVTRQTLDVNVVLTATFTLGDATATKDFALKVIAAEVVIDPVDALDDIEITGDLLGYTISTGRYNTKGNIVLPTTSMTLAVTWSSSNAAVLSTAGVVVRPAYGQSDSTVILTATIGTETKDFVVTVLAITEKPISLILEEAATILLLSGGIEAGVVTGKLELATEVGSEGVTVTWESSNEYVITNTGSVYRPDMGSSNANITLTATLHKNDQTLIKTFNVVVTARTVAASFSGTVAEVMAQSVGTYARMNGVTVFGISSDGFFVADASGSAFIYGVLPSDFEQGSIINIEGFVAQYFNALQLSGTSSDPLYIVPSAADETVVTYPVMTVAEVNQLPLPTSTNRFNMMPITVTARVMVTGTGNYDVFLVPIDAKGELVKTQAIMIYYKSNIGDIRALAGQKIEIQLVLITYRTNDTVWTADFLQDAEDIIVIPQTDAEWVDVAKETLDTTFEKEYVVDDTLTLPTEIEGVVITWSSNNILFDVATGILLMPETGQEDVTLTATLTKGDVTDEFVVTFKAGEKPLQTVDEALDVAVGDLVHVRGVVTSSQYYRTFFIQDATGGIAIYTSSSTLIAFLTDNYGKEVDLVGTRAAYNGLNQISYVVINTLVGDGTMPTAVNVDAFNLDSVALAPYQGQLVEFTGLAVTAVTTDSYGNVEIKLYDADANKQVTMKWDSRVTLSIEAAALLATIAVDDVVDVVAPLAWSTYNNVGPFLYFTSSTLVTEQELTDTERVALAKLAIIGYFASEYNEATTLSPKTSLFGATIVYDTASVYFDVATGAITLPEIGRETVSVTATITLGTATDTATIEFIVGVQLITALYTTADATIVTVQGVVVAAEYYNTFFIQDSSGAVAIYTSSATFSADLLVGNLVEVTGELDFYSGLVQVKPSAVTVLATGQALPETLDIESYNLVGLLDVQGQNISLMELVVTDVYVDSFGNITLTFLDVSSDISVPMKWDSRQTLTTEAQTQIDAVALGDVVDLVTSLGWKNGPYLFYSNTSIITVVATPSAAALLVVDQAFADADADELTVVATATEATTIVLPVVGTNLSTIVWTSSDDALINPTTGAVVLPASGQVVVTLSATVTLNAAEKVVTFDVTVGAETTGE